MPSSKYFKNLNSTINSRRRNSLADPNLQGIVLASPLTFGSKEEYYGFNLQYFKNSTLYTYSGDFNKAFRQSLSQSQNPYSDFATEAGRTFNEYNYNIWKENSNNFVKRWESQYNQSLGYLYRFSRNTWYAYQLSALEDAIGSRTLAGRVMDFSIDGVPVSGGVSKPFTRPSANAVASTLSSDALNNVKSKGPFSALVNKAPKGFLISYANDLDVGWDETIEDINGDRLLSTYWPADLKENHSLRDIYDMFYSPSGRHWTSFRDINGESYNADKQSIYKEYIQDKTPGKPAYNLNFSSTTSPELMLLGPISNTAIVTGDGNNLVAASPVMTPILHRTYRVNNVQMERNGVEEFKADTVLYPSAVGAFGSNTLDVGNGNNIVYYDSSFRSITAGKGDQLFLPSFGSFNWSIDWIPGYQGGVVDRLNDSWLAPNLVGEGGTPLISPIPWDKQIVHPRDGVNNTTPYSYVDNMSKFAATPTRGDLNSQKNYLYSIFSQRGMPPGSKKILKTYLNLKQDTSQDDALLSRNPVNRLGGIRMQAGKLSESKGKANYTISTGNNTFYGMDWGFWEHLLPTGGTTTANQAAGVNGFKRAAQHEWNPITMIGGRGNNTFNLGDVIDNITNNGLFYKGDKSYYLSLTHDGIYTKEEARQQGLAFGNVYSSADQSQAAIQSTVNLNLQADPSMYLVEIQAADPGQSGSTLAQQAGAWNGLANAANKFVGNGAKIQEDIAKGFLKDEKKSWLKNSSKLARIVGSVVPFMDTAIAITGAVLGLFNLFSSKPAKPPKQQLQSTYLTSGLDTGNKAVVINDWHPYTRVNLNVPSLSASDWKALSLELKKPVQTGTRNTDLGAYLQVNKSTTTISNGAESTEQKNFPLVVLEHLDIKDSLERGAGYYTYSFDDPDNTDELKPDQFNPIRSSSLRLFGNLPNPEKLLGEDGKPLANVGFPANYIYKTNDGFDMRYDAANYSAFFGNPTKEANKNFYSKYYFGSTSFSQDGLPPGWSKDSSIDVNTSNVSLEFDSRVHGWYWMPVLKINQGANGELDAGTALNPEQQTLDLDQSRLWIKEQNGWTSFRYNELDSNLKAFRYSKLATTFYTSSADENNNGMPDGQEEVGRKKDFDAKLKSLDPFFSKLTDINQTFVRDELKLYSLAQIKNVETKSFTYKNVIHDDARIISFNSVDKEDNEVSRKIAIYKENGTLKPAVAVDDSLTPIEPSTFQFDWLDQGTTRKFAGFYNNSSGKTTMFEYVASNTLFNDAQTRARGQRLPTSLTSQANTKSHLAVIDNAQENDAITGLFTGHAWIGADDRGSQSRFVDTKFWQWLEGGRSGTQFWSTQDINIAFNAKGPVLKDGPVNNEYSNWPERGQGRPFWDAGTDKSRRFAVTIDGDSGTWGARPVDFRNERSPVNGYLVEFSPIDGLPSIG